MRTARRLPALITLALVLACDASQPRAEREAALPAMTDKTTPAAPAAPPPAGRDYAVSATVGQATGDGAAGRAPTAPSAASDRAIQGAPSAAMLIRTGNANVEVDSLEPAVATLQETARRLGGYVGNTSMQAGRDEMRSAMLEVKVPAARFDELVRGLRPIGRVENVSVNAEDVSEEFTDVTARVENARRLEARLQELLATRTGRLADVLATERELARVREEIERWEGRLRYLRTRAAMSTLNVTLHEPGPIVGRPGEHPIVDAFRQAWRNFVGFVAWLIAASGVLLPLALLAWLAIFLGRRLNLRRPRRRPDPVTPPAAVRGAEEPREAA